MPCTLSASVTSSTSVIALTPVCKDRMCVVRVDPAAKQLIRLLKDVMLALEHRSDMCEGPRGEPPRRKLEGRGPGSSWCAFAVFVCGCVCGHKYVDV